MNRNTLLLVDDMEVNRAILRNLFEHEYNLLEAENGEQAVMLIQQYHDSLAAVLLDVVMPVMDGYQVMAKMTKLGLMTRIPVIIITSEDSMENEVRAFDLGAADIIIKPFEPHVVRRRVQNAVDLNRHKMHLEELVEEQASKLRESRDVIMDTLSSVIEHRSAETGQHVLRLRMFTRVLLTEVMRCCPEYELNERAISIIAEAAALHDIGKISIPDTILNKPGRLTAEEFEIMKTHTLKGCEILSGLDRIGDKEYLVYAYNICRYHHERWDGKGYPDQLVGDNIPIYAQVVGVADAYDALTSDRVYKKAILPERAVNMILNGECGAFSAKLLECLKNVRGQFFELTQKYADGGNLPDSDFARRPDLLLSRSTEVENAQVFGQLKYFTLLRYLGDTVLEVDIDSGVYHLVYQQNEDFQALRSGTTFEESFLKFVEEAIHPEDREDVQKIPNSYIQDFFARGLMRRARRYRVLHRATGEYLWYEGTALRIDTDNPRHHKFLIVWRQLENSTCEPLSQQAANVLTTQNLPVGIHQCLCDQWFTMTYINEGFTALFGYSRKEIEEQFQNRYIEMIHPDDRQTVQRMFVEQLSSLHVQDLQYRIITKQKQVLWVLDKCQLVHSDDGREYLNCVLTDITQIKQEQEQLHLSLERYQTIQNQTGDIIFETDLEQGVITYSSNWQKKFGYQPLTSDIAEQVRKRSHLFPEDIPRLIELMDDISAGIPYREAELRIAKADGRYLWCRIRVTTQYDDAGKPVKAVGVILDIDSEKRRTQELLHKMAQDALTRLYTKNAAQKMIQQTLKERDPSCRFAMMVIDLDNFKLINDSRGHMFGDTVLSEAASRLKMLFQTGDIVCRFGGDEFLVFLRYAAGESFLEEKAKRIKEIFRGVMLDSQAQPLTCSIGISICPDDGADFQTLFQNCDLALYQAKLKGKDQYAFYHAATMSKVFGLNMQKIYTAGTRIESDDVEDSSVDSIVPQAFKLLYTSGNIETAINAILEMVGKRYDVSRVYIFEDSEDGSWCRNTFEWCNTGIAPQIECLQHVSRSDFRENYQKYFDEHGIFYCRDASTLSKDLCDILQPRGVRSMLQCAVRDEGKFVGFVGFDDCTVLRMWTQSQIDALTFISELLSTFLLKNRAQDRALDAAQNMRMALDHQNAWIYVIDPKTHALRFINEKMRRIAPDAQVGMCCHKAFFNRETPCEKCPSHEIHKVQKRTLEIYNPVLDVWALADACLIRWDGQDACLVSCRDITKLKSGQSSREA